MSNVSTCNVNGCEKLAVTAGLCNAHYKRLKRYGDATVQKKIANGSVKKWLLDNLTFDGSECLIFPFARNEHGYGTISFDGIFYAHRWMCIKAHGDNPVDKPLALHRCGNGHLGCVNPSHLYWGDYFENMRDTYVHGTRKVGSSVFGAKLTEEKVRTIRAEHGPQMGYGRVAKKYGVSQSTIVGVIRKETWGHVS